MTPRHAILTVVICVLLLASIGAGLGVGLGALVPSYYRSVFRNGEKPDFNPVTVGLGQGLTQGAAGGAVIGLILVALLCWRDLRLPLGSDQPSDESARSHRVFLPSWQVLFIVGFLLSMVASTLSGLVFGLVRGEHGAYHRRFLEDEEVVAPILAADPAFAKVKVHEQSDGGLYLTGEVNNAATRDRLKVALRSALGERRAERAISGVQVSLNVRINVEDFFRP